MSNPNRPFGVPPDNDDLHREARTDAPNDADALDAWLNEIASRTGSPGTRSGNTRPDARSDDAASVMETAARFHRRVEAAQARDARTAGPDPQLWETIMTSTSPAPPRATATTNPWTGEPVTGDHVQDADRAPSRRHALRRQQTWNMFANIGLVIALLIAGLGIWRLAGAPGLPNGSDEAPTAASFAMQVASPEATPSGSEPSSAEVAASVAAPTTDCDFGSDIPIFNGIDESPWDGTAVLLTTTGDVVLTCPEEPEGTVLMTTSPHNSVAPLEWPGAVLIPSYGEKPEEARTRVLSLISGDVVEFGFPTGGMQIGTQGSPGSPWLVGPSPGDPTDVQILDMRTMQTRLLSEIAGAPLPDHGGYLTSSDGADGTLVFALLRHSNPTEGNATLVTEDLPGDLLVLSGSLDAASWITVPDDFPPVVGFDVAPDGTHVALHGAEGQMSQDREDTYSLVRLRDGKEIERSSVLTGALEAGEGIWVQGGKAFAYIDDNELTLLPLAVDLPEQPVFQGDGPLSNLSATADDSTVLVEQQWSDDLATMVANEQTPVFYAVDLLTREATMFTGVDVSDNVGWETPPDRFLVTFEPVTGEVDTVTYQVIDATTGDIVGTLDDVPLNDQGYPGYPHFGRASVAEAPDGSAEIIAFDSQHTYLMRFLDGQYQVQHLPAPEGILAETPMMLSMYVSPSGTMVSMSGEGDESGTIYLLDLTGESLAWQPAMSGEGSWLPFVPGAGADTEPAPDLDFDFSEAPDGTEFLDHEGLAAELRATEDNFAWPEGYDPDVEAMIEQNGAPTNSRFQEGMAYTSLGIYNQCAWYQTWLDAFESGDTEAAQEALQVMTEVFPTFPNQDWSVVAAQNEMASLAAEGDPAMVQQHVTVNCQGMFWEGEG